MPARLSNAIVAPGREIGPCAIRLERIGDFLMDGPRGDRTRQMIATAMGLFAAIPAVIAFNFFTRSVESLETQYHTFSEEMIGIIERAASEAFIAVREAAG